jgi:hypothetical protein
VDVEVGEQGHSRILLLPPDSPEWRAKPPREWAVGGVAVESDRHQLNGVVVAGRAASAMRIVGTHGGSE